MLAALPDLGALMAAVFLLLIAGALWVLIKIVEGSLGKAPLIGGWVNREIGGWLNDARNAVLRGASASWGAAVKMFDWAVTFERVMFGRVVTLAMHASQTIWHVATVQVPGQVGRLEGRIGSALASAESYGRTLFNTARADWDAAVKSAEAEAAALVNAARRDAAAAVAAAEAKASALVRAAEVSAANALARASTTLATDITNVSRETSAAIASAEAAAVAAERVLAGDIATGIHAAETYAAVNIAALSKGIYTDLETWGDQAVSRVWQSADGDIQALRRTLGADFPWLNDLTGALAGLGTAGLAGALIRSLAGAEAITRLADECIVPQCRNLGGFGNALGELLGDASTAAMLAWVIFMVTDPAGWAQDTIRVAGPVADATAKATSDLLGAL